MAAAQSTEQYVADAVDACQKGNVSKLRNAMRACELRSEFLGLLLVIAISSGGYEDIVQELVSAGANLNGARVEGLPEENQGVAPLVVAAEAGHATIVQRLLTAGADVNIHSQPGGITPLVVAAQHGHLEIVHQLISKGANVNVPNHVGLTPLYLRCRLVLGDTR